MKVGLFGYGYWGSKISEELVKHPSVSGVMVVDTPGRESLILDNDEITHVLIATPVNTHVSLCLASLRAGKHVMCEKNLAPSLVGAVAIVEEAFYQDSQLLVDYIYSFNPRMPLWLDLKPRETLEITLHQNGKLRDEDVMSMLGSHALAVAEKVVSLQDARLCSIIEYGSESPRRSCKAMYQLSSGVRLKINVSVEAEAKTRTMSTQGRTWCLDYANGIKTMLNKFFSGQDNSASALHVSRALEQALPRRV